jgi:hypothetical protein
LRLNLTVVVLFVSVYLGHLWLSGSLSAATAQTLAVLCLCLSAGTYLATAVSAFRYRGDD